MRGELRRLRGPHSMRLGVTYSTCCVITEAGKTKFYFTLLNKYLSCSVRRIKILNKRLVDVYLHIEGLENAPPPLPKYTRKTCKL